MHVEKRQDRIYVNLQDCVVLDGVFPRNPLQGNNSPDSNISIDQVANDLAVLSIKQDNYITDPVLIDVKKDKLDADNVFYPRPETYYRPIKGSLTLRNRQGINYFFAPPGQIYPIKTIAGCFGIGLGGVYNIDGTTLDLNDGLKFRLNGKQPENTDIVFVEGKDEFDVLKKYSNFLVSSGRVSHKPVQKDWQRLPIYCTWGDQLKANLKAKFMSGFAKYFFGFQANFESICEHITSMHASINANTGAGKVWTQSLDEKFVWESIYRLKEMDWQVGTIIIDADWMQYYGETRTDPIRFPNIRDLVKNLHTRGLKVIAWYPNWWVHPESSIAKDHPDWIIKDEKGKSTKRFDISQEEVRRHIQGNIETILGEYGFDGLKLDFGYDAPKLSDRLADPSYGSGDLLALKLHKIIYEAAHGTKEDALVIGISPNPFFADYEDMIRLNDNFSQHIETQLMRWKIASSLCPNHLIDSDGYNYNDSNFTLFYQIMCDLGAVSSLYYCRNLGLSNEQEAQTKRILDEYKKSLSK